jgi:predicted RNase H-like nuclease (RuvC/YqgF family)
MIIFGHTDKELGAARWAAVNAFRYAVERNIKDKDVRQMLQEMLARSSSSDPERWAERVVQDLVEIIVRLQTDITKTTRELESVRFDHDMLKQTTAEYFAHPLQEQVEALAEERDYQHKEAEWMADRIRQLERSLARSQWSRETDVTRLQEEIAALNRIVVEQQEQWNALH